MFCEIGLLIFSRHLFRLTSVANSFAKLSSNKTCFPSRVSVTPVKGVLKYGYVSGRTKWFIEKTLNHRVSKKDSERKVSGLAPNLLPSPNGNKLIRMFSV